MKRRLTKKEEFDIMKLVLDKFLLLGVFIMGYGFWKMVEYTYTDLWMGLLILISGAIVLVIFMMLLVREYEFIKR
ncbi:hypothetical protein JW949_00590 [Candidatus Woesearchaeota archaeon]|nr:hypothetical protein [Candidatus Woesearchaeota archaeon]